MSRNGQDRMYGEEQLLASRQDDTLELAGHELVENVVHRGAVYRWKCTVCNMSAQDVEKYLDHTCQR